MQIIPIHSPSLSSSHTLSNIDKNQIIDINLADNDGLYLIHGASRHNSYETEHLIHHNADINAMDRGGQRPIHYAYNYHRLDVVHSLLELNADINIRDNMGQSPLHLASRYIPSTIHLLLYMLADVNVVDSRQYYPLYFPTKLFPNLSRAYLLLEVGACPNVVIPYLSSSSPSVYDDNIRTLLLDFQIK